MNTNTYMYRLTIVVMSVLALVGFGLYAPTLPVQHWPEVLFFLALVVYFQLRSIEYGGRMSYSLGVSLIFPVLFIYGIGAAMVVSVAPTLLESYYRKKTIDRTIFNCAQLILAAWIGGLVFEATGGITGSLHIPASLLPIFAGGGAYAAINVISVTLISSLALGKSWWSMFGLLGVSGFSNYLVLIYVGSVFALFVSAYPGWGLLLFAVLLVVLAEILQLGVKINLEQNLRREAEEQLIIDAKTGVYNFRYLNEWLSQENMESLAVLFVDLDDFKMFNDRYGHDHGDRVLRTVAQVMEQSVRQEDKVIRFGGEEFVVLLKGMNRDMAVTAAKRIQRQLSKIPEARYDCPITVSIGIATYPEDARDKHELLRLADLAMYTAKTRGKNQCCWHREKSKVAQSVNP